MTKSLCRKRKLADSFISYGSYSSGFSMYLIFFMDLRHTLAVIFIIQGFLSVSLILFHGLASCLV